MIHIKVEKISFIIHFTTEALKTKQTNNNKQKERKIKQTYARIDLDLDDS